MGWGELTLFAIGQFGTWLVTDAELENNNWFLPKTSNLKVSLHQLE